MRKGFAAPAAGCFPSQERTRIVSPSGALLGQAISIAHSFFMQVSKVTDSEPSILFATSHTSVIMEISTVSPALRSAWTGTPEALEITTLPSTGLFRPVSIVSIVTVGFGAAASEEMHCILEVIGECGSDDRGKIHK